MFKKEHVKKISAGIVSLLIILLIFAVLLPPATSVYISTGSLEETVICNESSITFQNVNLTIRGEERIPISYLNFSIFNEANDACVGFIRFTVEGVELSDFPTGKLTVTKKTEILDSWYDYGYGYGYDERAGQPYYFGYGYGYGNNSYGDITILYDITYITSQIGTFYTKLSVNSTSDILSHIYESSPSVSFEVVSVPWTGSDVSSTYAEEVSGSGTVDAMDQANVTVDVVGSGNTLVMIANYTDNPGSIGLSSVGYFFDAYVPDVSNATSITVKYWVKETPTAAYQALYYLNQTTLTWKLCSNTGYTADTSKGAPYVGYNYAIMTSTTQPRLSDLTALPFYSGEDDVTIALEPLAQTYYKSGDQLYISGYILPAMSGEEIGVEINDSSSTVVFVDQLTTNATGIFTTNTQLGTVTTSDGTVTIYADFSGTSINVTQTFIYDATAPSASINAIASSVNTAPPLSGGSSDAIALHSVFVSLNFTNITNTYYWDFDTGSWTTTATTEQITQTGTADSWNLSTTDPGNGDYVSNQLYTVSAYARDQAGNQGTTTTDTFIFDTTPPTSTITTPSSAAKLNALLEIAGTATDISGVASVDVQIINASSYYWNGSAWSSTVSWLNAEGTTSWTYDSSSVEWVNGGENAAYTIKSRGTDTLENTETPGVGISFTYGITANIEPMETSYRGGAYHGARVNWSDVGMPTYKLYASLSEITNVSASGVVHMDTVSGSNTTSFSNLSSSYWGHEVYYAVTTIDSNGVEAPDTFIGTINHTKCWKYKIEIEAPTGIIHGTDRLGWTAHYKIRLLSATTSPICMISEFLGPNATAGGDIPNRPVVVSKSSFSNYPFTFFEAIDWEMSGTYSGGALTQQYQGWVMIWNRLPSQGGYWEAFAEKYIESPITIT